MTILSMGDISENTKHLQRALGEKLSINITADGHFGRITASALETFQTKFGFSEVDPKGFAYYGPKSQNVLQKYIDNRYVQIADMLDLANELKVELACVRAVTDVEAKEFGFFKNGFPVILFERHKFYQNLKTLRGVSVANKYAALRGDICNPTAGGYVGKEAEIRRLDAAIEIDETAALMSASWGLFQIMGFNHSLCGYPNVQKMVADMKESEDYQLKAFGKFVGNQRGLINALRAKDWATFARLYNGSNYAINRYDTKLATAYAKYQKLGLAFR